MGSRICFSNRLPDNADAADPANTLRTNAPHVLAHTTRQQPQEVVLVRIRDYFHRWEN